MNYSEANHPGRHAFERAGRLFTALAAAAGILAAGCLRAADIEATSYPGQTTTNSASVTVPALPPNVNVLFSFDCTGSMSGVLSTAKTNALR